MKNILLACAAGYSTSMLMEKMRQAAKEQGLEVTVDATAESLLDELVDNADIIMIGPQLRHAEKRLQEKYGDKLPVTVVDMRAYGMMNGAKVLQDAFELIENFNK